MRFGVTEILLFRGIDNRSRGRPDVAPTLRPPGHQQLVLARKELRQLGEVLNPLVLVFGDHQLIARAVRVQSCFARHRGVATSKEIEHRPEYRRDAREVQSAFGSPFQEARLQRIGGELHREQLLPPYFVTVAALIEHGIRNAGFAHLNILASARRATSQDFDHGWFDFGFDFGFRKGFGTVTLTPHVGHTYIVTKRP